MTRREFADLVERTRAERPRWFDPERPDALADAAAVEAVERALGVRLPPDYVWFLSEYGGGDFVFASIYSADAGSDLYLPRNQGPPPLPPGHVAFSDDGCGDLCLFPVRDGAAEDRVLWFDHETDELTADEADGFLGFVARDALRPA